MDYIDFYNNKRDLLKKMNSYIIIGGSPEGAIEISKWIIERGFKSSYFDEKTGIFNREAFLYEIDQPYFIGIGILMMQYKKDIIAAPGITTYLLWEVENRVKVDPEAMESYQSLITASSFIEKFGPSLPEEIREVKIESVYDLDLPETEEKMHILGGQALSILNYMHFNQNLDGANISKGLGYNDAFKICLGLDYIHSDKGEFKLSNLGKDISKQSVRLIDTWFHKKGIKAVLSELQED